MPSIWPAPSTVTGPAAPGAVDPRRRSRRAREVRARTLRGDVTRAELALGWRTVPAARSRLRPRSISPPRSSGPDEGAGSIGGCGRPGIATWVSAHNYAPTELGVMSVSAELAPDRVDAALDGIAETVTRLALAGPATGRPRARSHALRARWARRIESMEGRAASLAAPRRSDGYEFLDREYARARLGQRPTRYARSPGVICTRIPCSAFSTCRASKAVDLTAERLASGLCGDPASAPRSRAVDRLARPRAPRSAFGRAGFRRAAHGAARSRPPRLEETGRAACDTRHLRTTQPSGSRPHKPGSAH